MVLHHFGAAQWIACIIAVRNSHAPALFLSTLIYKKGGAAGAVNGGSPMMQSGSNHSVLGLNRLRSLH